MRTRGLDHVEHCEDVGLECAFELFDGDVGDVLVGMLLAGVVDQHVEPAPLVDHRLDQALAMPRVAQVASRKQSLAAFPLDRVGSHSRIVVFVEIGDRDLGAFAGEQDRSRAPDTAVAAGNDGDLALQPP